MEKEWLSVLCTAFWGFVCGREMCSSQFCGWFMQEGICWTTLLTLIGQRCSKLSWFPAWNWGVWTSAHARKCSTGSLATFHSESCSHKQQEQSRNSAEARIVVGASKHHIMQFRCMTWHHRHRVWSSILVALHDVCQKGILALEQRHRNQHRLCCRDRIQTTYFL